MRRPLVLLAALLAGLALPAPGLAADPAEPALRERDAYVSPRALGDGAAAGEERLAEAARALSEEGRDAKLAVVAGPVGAPSLRAYVNRLRARLGYTGTLVVTAPGRPVVAEGPLPPGAITRRLRAERVNAIPDPLERVSAAAGLVSVVRPEDPGSGTRQIGALLGLAVLGAGWAVAWGLRREGRAGRQAVSDARNRGRVLLDALDAQAARLGAADPPPASQSALAEARAQARAARHDLEGAASAKAIAGAQARLEAGLAALARARAGAGHPAPDDPFSGLCRIDPAHGGAVDEAVPVGADAPVPACGACAAAAPRERRRVAVGGVPVPFDEARPEPSDPAVSPGAASRS